MTVNISKTCAECGKPFQGRADKKFCSDSCRSAHNNSLRTGSHHYVRQVHYILKKNHRILTEFNSKGKRIVSMEKLRIRGFDFNHCTCSFTSEDGIHYRYCYDHGFYQKNGDDKIVLVKKELEH